jgi:hypothetical protein
LLQIAAPHRSAPTASEHKNFSPRSTADTALEICRQVIRASLPPDMLAISSMRGILCLVYASSFDTEGICAKWMIVCALALGRRTVSTFSSTADRLLQLSFICQLTYVALSSDVRERLFPSLEPTLESAGYRELDQALHGVSLVPEILREAG